MGGTDQAADVYRRSFQPSHLLEAPYLIVSATTVVGDSAEHAELLAATGASEIMTYPVAYALEDRIAALESIASAWF